MSLSNVLRVRWVDQTGSTNSDLAALARDGEPEGAVLATMNQVAGRGRLDRAWVAPRDSSLAMSILLQPQPEFIQWGWLSLLAGMAVQQALADLAEDPARIQLKWPNDVLIDGAKVCGILSERIELAAGACAIIGIGINISIAADELPVPTATSLRIAGLPEDPQAVLDAVLRHFAGYYESWQRYGQLRVDYQQRCASIGRPLRIITDPDSTVEGIGHGVDERGGLQIRTATGIQTFYVGDVIHARIS